MSPQLQCNLHRSLSMRCCLLTVHRVCHSEKERRIVGAERHSRYLTEHIDRLQRMIGRVHVENVHEIGS